MTDIATIILAAGGSSRFGEPKQLLDWHGKPMVAHVTDRALAADLGPVAVVVGCRAAEVRSALGARPISVLVNRRWELGLSTSVQVGLAAVPPEADGVLFLQADQPLVTPTLLRALAARLDEHGAPLVFPELQGQRGSPMLFGCELLDELARISGDEGGRQIVGRHAARAATVAVDDPFLLRDVDTPQAYRELLAASGEGADEVATLRRLRNLIIDMDGVLWRGETPMPGLPGFFDFLHRREIAYMLVTNNSSRTPDQYVSKLARFGVRVERRCVLTSGVATAAYLQTVAEPGTRVYVIGEQGLATIMEAHGFRVVRQGDEQQGGSEDRRGDEPVRYVVVGWDRDLTWQKLAQGALLIHRGAGFIGTNPDTSFPTPRGPVPGNGAQLAALETTTGVEPTVVGKPEGRMYAEAMRAMGASPITTAVIGDRLDTDLAGGVRAGISTILTLSGIATREDLAASPVRVDLVYDDIGALTAAWRAALENGDAYGD